MADYLLSLQAELQNEHLTKQRRHADFNHLGADCGTDFWKDNYKGD